ncbi:MAG: methylmalonyl Co-A mutase-associated GTPase MeaB [Candidatus Marinimicrobia bacterium]|nr:methylmalonyl Co-A mutase-associated GTPase MeaB [Candidatus Neomarinimicrobiota bacterium]MCK9560741.1 methylmalonyl Co-A mutase-associated GTPase MeaB [Candidatus Neomarinimicrobiota bacterium]MDD5540514.1 methylmalonyl Co-A mutase-associated GTPase MeaB [Candidatus Neomarinimicrobiota bacterium]
MTNLAEKILKGDMRSIGRAISIVENNDQTREQLIDELFPYTGRAVVWGITGAPGSGKSTLLDGLIANLRNQNRTVAIIAVDPSSPFTGGAILGDRLRMQRHATDPGVFIRSMASRGHLGGIASATADAIKILDAAGFDLIVIETIGVGQTEIEVVELADIVLLVLVPGMGDEIQALKAGVMEIGDIFIINKKDLDGALKLKTEVEYVLHLKSNDNLTEINPVILTSATQNAGLTEALSTIDNYLQKMQSDGRLPARRQQRIENEIRHIVRAKLRQIAEKHLQIDQKITQWARQIGKHRQAPYSLINEQLSQLLKDY